MPIRAEQNVQVGGTEVDISSKVIFDQTFSMQSYLNAIARRCYYYLRNIARIRRLLLEEECKIIVHIHLLYQG